MMVLVTCAEKILFLGIGEGRRALQSQVEWVPVLTSRRHGAIPGRNEFPVTREFK